MCSGKLPGTVNALRKYGDEFRESVPAQYDIEIVGKDHLEQKPHRIRVNCVYVFFVAV